MGRFRIFMIDDHPRVRDGLRLHLAALPEFDVVGEAGSAAQALPSLDTLQVDVLLTDIGTQEMQGIELTDFIRRQAMRSAVLVLTRHAHPRAVAQALRAGARGCMPEDAPAAQIVDAIRMVAHGGTCLGTRFAEVLFRESSPAGALTSREQAVLALIAQGKASKLIAQELCIGLRTVEAHRQAIRRKLQIAGQAQLVKYAVQHANEEVEAA